MTQIGLLPGIEIKKGVLAIREMRPGKARTEAIEQLAKQAENWVKDNSHLGVYIKGNVPSSKNSKTMVTIKRGGKEFTVPVSSKAVQKYVKESKCYWLQNKVSFLNRRRGLPWPISLEFTFIRNTLGRFDFINAAQILCDLMGDYGYIPDDETCYIVPVFNPTVFYSQRYAGVVIKVINGNEIKPAF